MVQFPTFQEKPGVTSQVDAHVAVAQQFASNIPYSKGKNWEGVLAGKTGLPPKRLLPDS
ncbi:hypothetical protein PAECIP111802_01490 [Paenibacillus allorhizosphaerae]|uniref:Uncharacterized protein n=1 Tax=Paenibacillus allorhizosphaerae TaxID=2849866 RepID=A0ABN7THU4_9BACL|nr:hypothetical protein PAECIP111802_01490 [Paenibacillus allorhizosphaerae]